METLSKNKLQYLRKFLQKKVRKLERKCLIEGNKICLEALENGYEIEILVYALGEGKQLQQVITHRNVKNVYKTTPKTIRSISDVETPQGVIGLVSFPVPEKGPGEDESHSRYLALDTVTDPGNVGTIIRTASWYGWDGVLCSSGCVEISCGKVIRSSMGAVFHVPIWENVILTESLEMLKKVNFTIIGSLPHDGKQKNGCNLHKTALVIGSETKGISTGILQLCDSFITVIGNGKAESLNAAVSAGILMDRIN